MAFSLCMPVGAAGEVSLDALENVHILDAEAVTEETSVEEPAVAQAPAAPESAALESASGAPAMPIGLTVSGTGTSRTLRWTAPAGGSTVKKYTISYCKMSDLANLPLVILTCDKSVAKLVDVVGSTTYTLNGLAAGAEYFFTVAAVNDAGKIGDMVSCLDGMLSGGSGTEADPYLISKNNDLVKLREASRAYHQCNIAFSLVFDNVRKANSYKTFGNGLYFKQTADLSLSGGGIMFFCGVYDGGGHSVALTINAKTSNAMAFIEKLGDAGCTSVLKNLTVTGSVDGSAFTSGLTFASGVVAAANDNSTIYNVGSSATVTAGNASTRVGGLVGTNAASIVNCWCTGAVSSTTTSGFVIGGLVGWNAANGLSSAVPQPMRGHFKRSI